MPIKRKLMAIILASTATALLLVAAAILIHEFFSFREAAIEDLKTQAEIIGNDSTTAPTLGDAATADKKLSALSAKPDIVGACLYKAAGPRDLYKIFATYHSSDREQFDFPKQPLAEGWMFSNGNLVLYHYFNSGDTPGAIFLDSDLRGLRERLWHYALLIGAFTLMSLLITFVLASRLLRVISQPIYHLSQTARVVSTQKNYAVRAIKESNDELGNLIEGFNEMLSQIQERDVALHRVNEDLEQRVRERTRDLEQQFARISLINQITQGVAARQDFESIVSIVLQQLEDHLPVDYGSSYMFDARSENLNVLVRGPKSQPIADTLKMPDSVPLDLTPFRQCVKGEMVYFADIRKEDMPLANKILGFGFNSIVGTPLMVENKMFGLIVLMRREADAFSRAERDFIHGLSAHVALAIHQAQLYQDLQKAYNDLRQSQQAAMQQERLKALGQMASGVAHDINNALSPVVGFSDLIARSEQNISATTKKHLQYIKTAGEDIAHIVKRLREFYRPRDQHESLQSLKLGVISKEVVDMMQPRWRDIPQVNGINIEMHTEFDSATPEFAGIESEVREALTNLILNAVDALPHGGTITVRTAGVKRPIKDSELATYVALEVCDTGVGMDEQTQKRCLEPFFSTKGKRGTGLGLAMVYGVVERHEGKIEIESEPGKGTTMRILFAIRKLAVPDATEFFENEQPPPPLRILCIDDEPALRMLICEILEHDGHKIEAADGGQAGINAFQAALVRKDPFEVVITDLGMPFVDGNAVARAVKSQSSATPVIMLTGWGAFLKNDGDIPKEVDGVLSKPPRIQEMRAMLRRVSHKWKA
ncbi:MAG TPA: ATP-binding protein [Candidatus Acidoferrales bacterium]|jgi:signal transduction histidine kinase/ActR/RegA family two-component response regulator|nr:ATP-binding protein [Candidatus Acidoferrales bacterium]